MSNATMMDALQISGPNTLRQVRLPVPEPKDGEILVKTAFVGICGTDLHQVKGEFQRPTVARCQQLGLPCMAALPHGSDGVNDVSRRQPVGLGDPGVPGGAAAQRPAFDQQIRARRPVNRAIDTPASG